MIFAAIQEPLIVKVGDFRTALLYAASSWFLFAAIAGGLFYLLTTDNSLKREIKELLGGLDISVGRLKAAVALGLACVGGCLWVYRASLASRFTEVAIIPEGASAAFEFRSPIVKTPARFRADEIAAWTSQVDWTGRVPRRTLVVNLKTGQHLRSLAANPQLHQEAVETLEGRGVEILR